MKLSKTKSLRGGLTKKSKELKTTMNILNHKRDLQGSACRFTSAIPFSCPLLEAAISSSWSVGHVRNPYATPLNAAPKCALQHHHHQLLFIKLNFDNFKLHKLCFTLTIHQLEQNGLIWSQDLWLWLPSGTNFLKHLLK